VIKPGQLVVIVGTNGSGKSSTIKLLTRLFDPTNGEICFDGQPLPSYKLNDIRNSIAILRQDHPVLPLSLRENVAFGLPESEPTDSEVRDAVQQGGAHHFIQKLKDGMDSTLDANKGVREHFTGEQNSEIKALSEELSKTTDLSGGETQRLSA
jgi:ABC-type multidrug transport system fused ATPase/permease subunit